MMYRSIVVSKKSRVVSTVVLDAFGISPRSAFDAFFDLPLLDSLTDGSSHGSPR